VQCSEDQRANFWWSTGKSDAGKEKGKESNGQKRSVREEGEGGPDIKVLVRKFYRLVHPDLFTRFPEQQKANQSALTEFMSFIDQWRKRPNGTPYGNVTKKRLEFYIFDKAKNAAQEDTDPQDQPQEPAFKKVPFEMLLNAPYASVHARVADLFGECGLPTEFSVVGAIAVKSTENVDIEDFLSTNANRARELALKENAAKEELDRICGVLEKEHGIDVVQGGLFGLYMNVENAKMLLGLEGVLQKLWKEDAGLVEALRGARVSLDASSGSVYTDYEQGVLYLDRDSSVDDWEECLRNVDALRLGKAVAKSKELEKAEEEQLAKKKKAAQDAEEVLSAALGVRTVAQAPVRFLYRYSSEQREDGGTDMYMSMDLDLDEEYQKYLDFLISMKSKVTEMRRKRPWKAKKFRNMTLCVRSMPKDEESGEQKLWDVDYDQGNVHVWWGVSPKQLLDILGGQGGRLAVAAAQEAATWDMRRQEAMTRLGLSSISSSPRLALLFPKDQPLPTSLIALARDSICKDPAVLAEREAIRRILEHARQLRQLNLSGLELGVADSYSVGQDGALWIKYDFDVESMRRLMLEAKELRGDAEPLAKE